MSHFSPSEQVALQKIIGKPLRLVEQDGRRWVLGDSMFAGDAHKVAAQINGVVSEWLKRDEEWAQVIGVPGRLFDARVKVEVVKRFPFYLIEKMPPVWNENLSYIEKVLDKAKGDESSEFSRWLSGLKDPLQEEGEGLRVERKGKEGVLTLSFYPRGELSYALCENEELKEMIIRACKSFVSLRSTDNFSVPSPSSLSL